jgi:hypothetical protein
MAGATTPIRTLLSSVKTDDGRRFVLALLLAVGLLTFITVIALKPSNLPPEALVAIVGYISGFLTAVVIVLLLLRDGQEPDKSSGSA